jgi:hypothetical protein
VGSVELTLPAPGEGLITTPCQRGQIGPRRDCGFAIAVESDICAPGELTEIDLPPADACMSRVYRVCEASAQLDTGIACTYLDALANVVVLDGQEGTAQFPCPGERDGQEPGGRYAIYVAELVGL